MKILLIGTVASSFYGFRAELIKTLLEKGHCVYAFTSEYSEEDLEKIYSLGAIPVTYELKRGGMNPFTDLKSTYFLAKKIKSINPDIVFSYFAKPVIFGTLAAKMAKVPKVIGMLEGLGYSFTEQPDTVRKMSKTIKNIQVLLYKVVLPQLDTLIFLNQDDPKDLLAKYSIKVKKVAILGGIGVNLSEYPYTPILNIEIPIKFLFVGRLLKEKGIYEFVSAATIVKRKYPKTEFTVLGDIDVANLGALKQTELDKLIESKVLTYPGHVDEVQSWIVDSHVFVLPSYREGIPRSTQEAMATGRPIITTDVPGCRETVVNELNGFLVERWNSEVLAEKMIYFIENPEKIREMGYESYKIAQNKFDSNKVNTRLLEILDIV